jgi:hypothetical protein
MGHRHDVLDVYDKNRALAVLARFKACDDVIDNFARMGDGEERGPRPTGAAPFGSARAAPRRRARLKTTASRKRPWNRPKFRHKFRLMS